MCSAYNGNKMACEVEAMGKDRAWEKEEEEICQVWFYNGGCGDLEDK